MQNIRTWCPAGLQSVLAATTAAANADRGLSEPLLGAGVLGTEYAVLRAWRPTLSSGQPRGKPL